MVGNLRKAWKSWDRLLRILGREGASPRVSGMFFKAVVQAVLFFWGGGVGDDPSHRPQTGGVQAQGSATDHREVATAAS